MIGAETRPTMGEMRRAPRIGQRRFVSCWPKGEVNGCPLERQRMSRILLNFEPGALLVDHDIRDRHRQQV